MAASRSDGGQGSHDAGGSGVCMELKKISTHFGVVNVKDFGAVGNNTANDAPAFQAAIDFIGAGYPSGGTQGRIICPNGQYRIDGPLYMRAGVIIEGVGDNFGAQLVFVGATSSTPLQFDGSNIAYNTSGDVPNGWIFRCGLSNIMLNMTGYSGSASELILIHRVHSSKFERVVIYDNSGSHSSKNTIHVKSINNVTFDWLRTEGTGDVEAHVYIDASTGIVQNLMLRDVDLERCARGIYAYGSTNYASVVIDNPYFESCSAGVYWEASHTSSRLLVTGGSYFVPNNDSDGVVLIADNATILGGYFYSGASGRSAIHLGGTRKTNSRYIGATPGLPMLDPYNDLQLSRVAPQIRRITQAAAATLKSTGGTTFERGERIEYTDPVAGDVIGEVCTTGGTSGGGGTAVWRDYGVIAGPP